ncbi:hypothetical protein E4U34_005870 [Claviceps purpurea]|nr:hypothetical protein E4U50_001417 [Claviceps purpurea]KAG6215107.1 hypothetical protein E4U34_005870 [Claviceps purpurea]KAG6233471.1 hypothetical protein E4U26_002021 [Claviceps purpurea]KAG6317739.1 hypothetical protein E4U44_008493 [Claviceps purpurea]
MPQIVAPLAISPPRNNSRLFTSQDLFSSLTANLRHKDNRPSTLLRHMPEDDYSVPAPPPPSPGVHVTEIIYMTQTVKASMSHVDVFSRD